MKTRRKKLLVKMTPNAHGSVCLLHVVLVAIVWFARLLAAYQPRSLLDETMCTVGRPLSIKQAGGEPKGACVPLSVRCAFTCQLHSPNCTGFNTYANGSCEFFSGYNVTVTYQQGCTLWAVCTCTLYDIIWAVCILPEGRWRKLDLLSQSPFWMALIRSLWDA